MVFVPTTSKYLSSHGTCPPLFLVSLVVCRNKVEFSDRGLIHFVHPLGVCPADPVEGPHLDIDSPEVS